MALAVKLSEKADRDLQKLSDQFGENKMKTVELVLEYILTHKIDPRERDLADPGKEFKKLRDTIVSFIREQENRYLRPTKEILERVEKITIYQNPTSELKPIKVEALAGIASYLAKQKLVETPDQKSLDNWAKSVTQGLVYTITQILTNNAGGKV